MGKVEVKLRASWGLVYESFIDVSFERFILNAAIQSCSCGCSGRAPGEWLGLPWAKLGLSWVQVGASWGLVGAKLGPSWGQVGPK